MEDKKKLSTAAIESNSKADAIKANDKKKNKKKKTGFFAKIGRKLKEMWSELKQVSWPSLPTVIKKTGVVLAVVAVFLVCITLFDWPLTFALQKLYGG